MLNDKGEQRKIGKIFRFIGMLILMIGMFLIMITVFPFFYGINLEPALNQLLSMVGFGFGIVGFILISLSMFLRIQKRFETFTFLKCMDDQCNYQEVRDFRKGDYIFKELERKCKKCKSNLYIYQIAHLPLKKYQTEEFKIKDRDYEDKKEDKHITKTILKCVDPNCKFEQIRDFQKGDIVFKELEGKKCTICNSNLYISEIFYITEENFKELIENKA
ncbi:MAG: hypothetical protein ACTSVY_16630 [Candidatus Helarchaeota archaeon]